MGAKLNFRVHWETNALNSDGLSTTHDVRGKRGNLNIMCFNLIVVSARTQTHMRRGLFSDTFSKSMQLLGPALSLNFDD